MGGVVTFVLIQALILWGFVFAQYPHLPKMLKSDTIVETLVDGCEQGAFVLRLTRPDGQPLRGKVRQEFSTIAPGIQSMGLSAGAEGGENVQPYPVVDPSTGTLAILANAPFPSAIADARTSATRSAFDSKWL